MQSIWVGAAQTMPAGVLAQCLLVAGLMIVGCILVNNLKAYVPLVSYRFDGQMDSSSQEPPKLPIILAPNATLVRGLPTSHSGKSHAHLFIYGASGLPLIGGL